MTGVEDVEAGNRTYNKVYSRSFLSLFYDVYVLKFNMGCIWGCPTNSVLIPFFNGNFSRNHLDCGVATGYILAKILQSRFRKNSRQHLTLLDINPNSLRAAEGRILSVTTSTKTRVVEADVTKQPPEALKGAKFDSIAMMNLFHCIPGGKSKLEAIKTYKELLNDDGVLSGCTILGINHSTGWLVSLYLKWYNDWWKVFNNWTDTREDIEDVLSHEFGEVETTVVGMMLLFRATKPRRISGDLLV